MFFSGCGNRCLFFSFALQTKAREQAQKRTGKNNAGCTSQDMQPALYIVLC